MIVSRLLPARPYESLSAYRADGGGQALTYARETEAGVIIDVLDASGLRGRGGAGFPTGVKWRTVLDNASAVLPTTVVVNGAEGEPGTFKDRALMRANPYLVIEGALIAARVVGALEVLIAIRQSFVDERRRLRMAIQEMREESLFGDVEVQIVTGPEEYLFGEETGLLEVIDGRPPFPRTTPPFRRGVDEIPNEDVPGSTNSDGMIGGLELAAPGGEQATPPALVDNVETMANVPLIVSRGPEWFRGEGTERSPGTILCTVTGAVRHPDVAEIALGTTVRRAIELVGGGAADGVRIKAVLNGVSAAPLTPTDLDTPLTYEDMAAIGSGLGTASLFVVGDDTDMTAVAAGISRFLAVESCGQCTPCKFDGLAIADGLTRLCGTGAGHDDVATIGKKILTVADGARCGLGRQHQDVLAALLAKFGHELEDRIGAHEPIAPLLVTDIVNLHDGVLEIDETRTTKQPDWTYEPHWSGIVPVDRE